MVMDASVNLIFIISGLSILQNVKFSNGRLSAVSDLNLCNNMVSRGSLEINSSKYILCMITLFRPM